MDRIMMFEAAREGKVEVLHKLVQQNPSILTDIRLTSLAESVLHVATKSGQLDFVNELIKMDPQHDMARDMNRDGFRPLDIAVIMGNLAIVKTILSHSRDVGRLTGKDNRIALHYAAVKGRIDIINELLSTCPDCIQDVTVHAETALHLAVKYYQYDAFHELVKWLLHELTNEYSIINNQDGDGNTVLHLAVSTKQYACVNLLLDPNSSLRGTIKLNVRNLKGLTALDISDIVMQDSYDAKIRESLQRGGAKRGQDSQAPQDPPHDHQTNSQPHDHPQSEQDSKNWFKYFKFKRERDSPSDTRNVLLVVSALITTVTFQGAINPPSALFDQSRILSTMSSDNKKLAAFVSDFIFVFFNSLGFISSSLVIMYLTSGFPLHRELLVALCSMFLTYSAAMDINISGTRAEVKIQGVAWIILLIGLILPHLFRRPPWLRKRDWGWVAFWRSRRNGLVLPIGN